MNRIICQNESSCNDCGAYLARGAQAYVDEWDDEITVCDYCFNHPADQDVMESIERNDPEPDDDAGSN